MDDPFDSKNSLEMFLLNHRSLLHANTIFKYALIAIITLFALPFGEFVSSSIFSITIESTDSVGILGITKELRCPSTPAIESNVAQSTSSVLSWFCSNLEAEATLIQYSTVEILIILFSLIVVLVFIRHLFSTAKQSKNSMAADVKKNYYHYLNKWTSDNSKSSSDKSTFEVSMLRQLEEDKLKSQRVEYETLIGNLNYAKNRYISNDQQPVEYNTRENWFEKLLFKIRRFLVKPVTRIDYKLKKINKQIEIYEKDENQERVDELIKTREGLTEISNPAVKDYLTKASFKQLTKTYNSLNIDWNTIKHLNLLNLLENIKNDLSSVNNSDIGPKKNAEFLHGNATNEDEANKEVENTYTVRKFHQYYAENLDGYIKNVHESLRNLVKPESTDRLSPEEFNRLLYLDYELGMFQKLINDYSLDIPGYNTNKMNYSYSGNKKGYLHGRAIHLTYGFILTFLVTSLMLGITVYKKAPDPIQEMLRVANVNIVDAHKNEAQFSAQIATTVNGLESKMSSHVNELTTISRTLIENTINDPNAHRSHAIPVALYPTGVTEVSSAYDEVPELLERISSCERVAIHVQSYADGDCIDDKKCSKNNLVIARKRSEFINGILRTGQSNYPKIRFEPPRHWKDIDNMFKATRVPRLDNGRYSKYKFSTARRSDLVVNCEDGCECIDLETKTVNQLTDSQHRTTVASQRETASHRETIRW